jgi:4a-hydroxytetrahydrobiopterin dehydratase
MIWRLPDGCRAHDVGKVAPGEERSAESGNRVSSRGGVEAGAFVAGISISVYHRPAGRSAARPPWQSGDGDIMASKERVYSDAEVTSRLERELPLWYLENGWIRRKYKTHSWKGTLMVINTVGHLAEAAWHHPDITASYAWVEVRLQNHAAKGITDKDFALARKIEDVVQWQPGKEGGGLDGTPNDDQRFAYVKYDG